jgi:hypothetical protein
MVVSPHQEAGSLKRKALKNSRSVSEKEPKYCTMIADPWHCKRALEETLFDSDAFEKSIHLVYFDIP